MQCTTNPRAYIAIDSGTLTASGELRIGKQTSGLRSIIDSVLSEKQNARCRIGHRAYLRSNLKSQVTP